MASSIPVPEPTAVPFYAFASANCSADSGNSCVIDTEEVTKRDAIALVRLLVSLLSIFGSLSIIFSVLWRRILQSPKIHPIFVISVADCVLGLSWVLGGAFWFGRIEHRSWCYLPSLLTVIMEWVTVNLTVVYALSAYSLLKRQELSDVLTGTSETSNVWSPCKTISAYLLAWLTPAAIVLIIFGVVASRYGLVSRATECSCWCFPFFINIVPLAYPDNMAFVRYINHTRIVVLSSSAILLVVYLTGFFVLVFMYHRILRHIRNLRESAKPPSSPSSYGSVSELLARGHTQAKKRVLYFLSVFIATGIANVFLCAIFIVFEAVELHDGAKAALKVKPRHTKISSLVIYMVQSLTAPLQGFLNAVVYGWTRDDFVRSRESLVGTPHGRRRRHLTASLSSEGDTDSGGLVNSGTYDLRDPSPSLGGSRERARLTGSERRRERLSARGGRNLDKGSDSDMM